MRHDTTPTLTAPARAPGALARATPTTRQLAEHSLSANTRAAYARALRQFDAWRGAAPATDATLAAYLGWLFERGRGRGPAPAGASACLPSCCCSRSSVRVAAGPVLRRGSARSRRPTSRGFRMRSGNRSAAAGRR